MLLQKIKIEIKNEGLGEEWIEQQLSILNPLFSNYSKLLENPEIKSTVNLLRHLFERAKQEFCDNKRSFFHKTCVGDENIAKHCVLYIQDIAKENENTYVLKLCDGRYSLYSEINN